MIKECAYGCYPAYFLCTRKAISFTAAKLQKIDNITMKIIKKVVLFWKLFVISQTKSYPKRKTMVKKTVSSIKDYRG